MKQIKIFVCFFFYKTSPNNLFPISLISLISPEGSSNGTIMVFDIPSEGTAVKLQETLEHHKVSITDLASYEDNMVSGDADGNIAVWQCDETLKQLRTIRGAG